MPARRRRRLPTVMADVDNDKCNGTARTGNEKFDGGSHGDDDNNNEHADDDDNTSRSTTTTSEELHLRRCQHVSAAVTEVSHESSLIYYNLLK